jgi:hypothetical protein
MKSTLSTRLFTALVLLGILSACSPVKFDKASGGSVTGAGTDPGSGTDPDDGRDPGDDTGGGTDPRDPGDDTGGGGTTTPNTNTTLKYTQVIESAKNQVDFLFIIDDSTSMQPEQTKLAAKLSTFVEKLSSLAVDWQMCITVTRDQNIGTTAAPKWVWGYPINWVGNSGATPYLLKKGASQATLDAIFKNTINGIGAGNPDSGDERGIKAAYRSFMVDPNDPNKKSKNCYRTGSSVSVIVLSDEDERSVAGDRTRTKLKDREREYGPVAAATATQPSTGPGTIAKPIQDEDKPENLLAMAKGAFGNTARFTFNSIIVKSGDNQCISTQDSAGYPSYAGTYYEKISALTNGGVASICDADYGANLELFANLTINYQQEVTLKCAPVANSLKVNVTDPNGIVMSPQPTYAVTGATLKFTNKLIQGTKIELEYQCPAL